MVHCHNLYTVSLSLCHYLHVCEVLLLLISYHQCHKKRSILGVQIDNISTHKSRKIKAHLFSTICNGRLYKSQYAQFFNTVNQCLQFQSVQKTAK